MCGGAGSFSALKSAEDYNNDVSAYNGEVDNVLRKLPGILDWASDLVSMVNLWNSKFPEQSNTMNT